MPGKKEYRSAVRSRRMIRQAFIELLKEQPFEKITVTDIVNRADINRSTFYAHYEDIFDLADSVTDEILNETTALITDLDFPAFLSNPKPFLYKLFQIGITYIDLYKLSNTSDLVSKQVQRIKGIMLEKAIDYINLPAQITQSNMFLINSSFFIGGILNLYELWATGKLMCDIDEIVEQIAVLITNNAESYLESNAKATNPLLNV